MPLAVHPPDATPAELLREFVRARCGEAFAELVRRYAGLVTGTAARVLGGREAVEDVAQEVFALLARKAAAVEAATLPGWLHRVAVRRAAATRRRSAALARRDFAAFMNGAAVTENAPNLQWTEVLPALDRALDSLSEEDRAVVLLRYYEQLSWHEIAARLPLTADAARKRTVRAIALLGRKLKARGFSTTVAALTAGLASQWRAEAATVISPHLAARALTKAGALPAGVVLTTTLATMGPVRWTGVGVAAACLMAGALALGPLLHSSGNERPAGVANSMVNTIADARPPETGAPGPASSVKLAFDNRVLHGAVDVYQENISPVNENRLIEIKVKAGDRVPPNAVVAVMDSAQDKHDLECLRRGIIADRVRKMSDEEDKLVELGSELRQLQAEDAEDRAIVKTLRARVQTFEEQNSPDLMRAKVDLAKAMGGGHPGFYATQAAAITEDILSIRSVHDTLAREREIFTKYDLLNPEVAEADALRYEESQKLEELKARLENCEIRTISGGTVDRIGREAGEFVKPGEGILKIVCDPRQIVCFLPEDQSVEVKAGDIVWVASVEDKAMIFETSVISISLRMSNLPDATSPQPNRQVVNGRDVVIGYPGAAIKEGIYLLLPGQSVIVHLSRPGASD